MIWGYHHFRKPPIFQWFLQNDVVCEVSVTFLNRALLAMVQSQCLPLRRVYSGNLVMKSLPYLGDLYTMVFHLLTGMILQVPPQKTPIRRKQHFLGTGPTGEFPSGCFLDLLHVKIPFQKTGMLLMFTPRPCGNNDSNDLMLLCLLFFVQLDWFNHKL